MSYRKLIKRMILAGVALALLLCLGLGGALSFLSHSPQASANLADQLRQVVGDQPVAVLETVLLKTQDLIDQAEYRLGFIRPEDPFDNSAPPVAILPGATLTPAGSSATPSPSPSPRPATLTPLAPLEDTRTPIPTSTPAPTLTPTPLPPSPTPTATPWTPPPASAQGDLAGEAVWVPYISLADGRVVAYRTFIQPDPDRPYVLVGAVAFDLEAVALHYVIGFEDPYSPKVSERLGGAIPKEDKLPGILLAAFNGGFKYTHGRFGSMANGFRSAPPIEGLGTVVIFEDGAVRIGEWGKDFDQTTPHCAAYRQNGPLAIQDGQPTTKIQDSQYWGYTLSGGTVTWRSGMAISPNNRTLYYFAGPSLDIVSLTTAMMAVHPQSAIQLDINNYWVYFSVFQEAGGGLQAQPLFPNEWKENDDRYLRPYARDYFYITVKK